VLSLTGITDVRTGDTVTTTAMDIRGDHGLVYARGGLTTTELYEVTYLAGREDLPPDLAMAVMELVRHIWTHAQRGQGRQATTEPAAGYLIPNLVAGLLAPHDVGPGFS
jgi:hypothetical protein